MNARRLRLAGVLVVVVTACSTPAADVSDVAELEHTTPEAVSVLLAESDTPVVLNVWASWCGPCRSEAPLLRAAHREHGDRITFIGMNVRDSQAGARQFIAEFSLGGFEHLFDATGSVPATLGGVGVPITFFFAPGGALVRMHSGVIDEAALALQIDELLRREA